MSNRRGHPLPAEDGPPQRAEDTTCLHYSCLHCVSVVETLVYYGPSYKMFQTRTPSGAEPLFAALAEHAFRPFDPFA